MFLFRGVPLLLCLPVAKNAAELCQSKGVPEGSELCPAAVELAQPQALQLPPKKSSVEVFYQGKTFQFKCCLVPEPGMAWCLPILWKNVLASSSLWHHSVMVGCRGQSDGPLLTGSQQMWGVLSHHFAPTDFAILVLKQHVGAGDAPQQPNLS